MGESMTEDTNTNQGEGKPKRPWKPNRTKTVRSKKSFDRKKMEHLVNEDRPAYKGELDPRQKDPDRKPRSISFSEQKVMDKAAKLAEKESEGDGRARLAAHTDFRDLF